MGKIVRQPQLLTIVPNLELEFRGDPKEVNTAHIQVRNDTNHKIGFKVMTNAPHLLFVRPATHVISPGSQLSINVMLQPCHEDKEHGIKNHKLLIQSIIVRPQDGDESIEKLIARKSNSEELMETKLNCSFKEVYTSELVFPLSTEHEQDGEHVLVTKKAETTQGSSNLATMLSSTIVIILVALLSWYIYSCFGGSHDDDSSKDVDEARD